MKNYTAAEAAKIIHDQKDWNEYYAIARNFPLFATTVAQLNEAGYELLSNMPEYMTARRINNILKDAHGVIGKGGDEDGVEKEKEKIEARREAKKAGKGKKKGKRGRPAKEEVEADEVDTDEDDEEEAPKKKSKKEKADKPSKKAKKAKKEEDVEVVEDEDDDDDFDFDED